MRQDPMRDCTLDADDPDVQALYLDAFFDRLTQLTTCLNKINVALQQMAMNEVNLGTALTEILSLSDELR